jgi:hypothetical protein
MAHLYCTADQRPETHQRDVIATASAYASTNCRTYLLVPSRFERRIVMTVFRTVAAISLFVLFPALAGAAPLPLTTEEIAVLRGGAIDNGKAVGFGAITEKANAARTLVRKLGEEGNLDALDQILALEDAPLLQEYLNNLGHAFPWQEYEKRVKAYYDKPVLAATLINGMKEYVSRDTFELLLADITALIEKQRANAPLATSDIPLRNRRWAAIAAMTRTKMPGIEADLVKALLPGAGNTLQFALPNFAKFIADSVPNSSQAAHAAVDMLWGIATMQETPSNTQSIEILTKGLGNALPDANVDLHALKERVLALPLRDKAKIELAYKSAVQNNASLRDPTPDYVAALLANRSTHAELLRYAVGAIHDVNARTSKGDTLLGIAIANQRFEAVKTFLARGADPNTAGRDEVSPLYLQVKVISYGGVSKSDAEQSIRSMLARGANPNVTITHDGALIHYALTTDLNNVVKLLIEAGADVNAIGPRGKSPLTIAIERSNREMQGLIRKHGGREHTGDNDPIANNRKYEYSIGTVHVPTCFALPLRICERIKIRDADKIEIGPDREMRLTYFGDKDLITDARDAKKAVEREKFVAIVHGRDVVDMYRSVQIVDWRSRGCSLNAGLASLMLGGYGNPCWDTSERYCEKWSSHDVERFGSPPVCRLNR